MLEHVKAHLREREKKKKGRKEEKKEETTGTACVLISLVVKKKKNYKHIFDIFYVLNIIAFSSETHLQFMQCPSKGILLEKQLLIL